jgi:hypothetical protein
MVPAPVSSPIPPATTKPAAKAKHRMRPATATALQAELVLFRAISFILSFLVVAPQNENTTVKR